MCYMKDKTILWDTFSFDEEYHQSTLIQMIFPSSIRISRRQGDSEFKFYWISHKSVYY